MESRGIRGQEAQSASGVPPGAFSWATVYQYGEKESGGITCACVSGNDISSRAGVKRWAISSGRCGRGGAAWGALLCAGEGLRGASYVDVCVAEQAWARRGGRAWVVVLAVAVVGGWVAPQTAAGASLGGQGGWWHVHVQ